MSGINSVRNLQILCFSKKNEENKKLKKRRKKVEQQRHLCVILLLNSGMKMKISGTFYWTTIRSDKKRKKVWKNVRKTRNGK